MKKMILSHCVVIAFAAVIAAETTELLDLVPANANVIVNVDARKFMGSPLIKQHLSDKSDWDGLRAIEAKLAERNMTLEDCADQAVVFAETSAEGEKVTGGMLLRTQVDADDLQTLLTDASGVGPSARAIGGKTVLVTTRNAGSSPSLTGAGPVPMPDFEKSLAWVYPRPDVLLVTSLDGVESILAALEDSDGTAPKRLMREGESVRVVGDDPVVWAAFEMKDKSASAGTGTKGGFDANPWGNIIGGGLALYFKGENDEDLAMRCELRCKDAYNAKLLARQVNGFLLLSCSTLGGDPQLGDELIQSISIESKDDKLLAALNLSKDLRVRLNEFMSRQTSLGGPPSGGMRKGR